VADLDREPVRLVVVFEHLRRHDWDQLRSDPVRGSCEKLFELGIEPGGDNGIGDRLDPVDEGESGSGSSSRHTRAHSRMSAISASPSTPNRIFMPTEPSTFTGRLSREENVTSRLITSRGKDRADVESELSLHTLAGLARSYPGTDPVAAATALICLRHLTDPDEALADGADDVMAVLRERAAAADPDDELLLSEIRDNPRRGWVGGWASGGAGGVRVGLPSGVRTDVPTRLPVAAARCA
jgi:hypothetical protein